MTHATVKSFLLGALIASQATTPLFATRQARPEEVTGTFTGPAEIDGKIRLAFGSASIDSSDGRVTLELDSWSPSAVGPGIYEGRGSIRVEGRIRISGAGVSVRRDFDEDANFGPGGNTVFLDITKRKIFTTSRFDLDDLGDLRYTLQYKDTPTGRELSGTGTFKDDDFFGVGDVEADGKFKATDPTKLRLTSPTGQELLQTGQPITIRWDKLGNSGDNVVLFLYRGSDVTPSAIITNSTPNIGSFVWTPPNSLTTGSDYYVQVVSPNLRYRDDSGNIRIRRESAPDAVTAPTAGETLKVRDRVPVKWDVPLHKTETVTVELLRGDLGTAAIATGIRNTGRFDWSVGIGVPSGNDYKIRVRSADSSVSTTSAAPFRIAGILGETRVLVPSAGARYFAGSRLVVRWNMLSSEASRVQLVLYKGDMKIKELTSKSQPNSHQRAITFPRNIVTGSNYRLVVESQNTDTKVSSGEFTLIGR